MVFNNICRITKHYTLILQKKGGGQLEESGTKTRASHSDENNKQERRRPCRLNIDSPLQRNNVERRREREKKLVSLCSFTTAAAENERVVHWRKILVLKNEN